jgi:hypothetical protein
MAPDPHHRTQEQSIKARKHQLFEDEDLASASGPSLPFPELLRVTPAEPLSPAIKALLWVVGTLVVLMLLAALLNAGGGRKAPKTPAASVAPASLTLG